MLHQNLVLLIHFNPFTSRENKKDIEGARKPSPMILDLDTDNRVIMTKLNVPNVCAPFDFDGKRIMWIEYLERGMKEIQIYDCEKFAIEKVKEFGRAVEGVSFGKLYRQFALYVEDHKRVCLIDLALRKSTVLYEHRNEIACLDSFEEAVTHSVLRMPEDESDRNKNRDENNFISGDGGLSRLCIVSVDVKGIVYLYKGGKVQTTYDISKSVDFPPGLVADEVFDMGYPYTVKMNEHHLIMSTDFGILVFHI
eukprot:TRINITY_DN2767_c0_g1_i21.p1 TRINITY_DN2767_c0_g1~~TRINITY_DN2767_c0_g1_i21.p1  ORF type:complete len:252 (-),score=25.46 TRINITY_DN2767_c0_g1_i21:323-1078(-)